MKKLVLILVVLSVVLMSCASPVSEIESPFEGTWRSRYDNNIILQFTGSLFKFTATNYGIEFSGSYSYTETTITFNPDEGIEEDEKQYVPWTQDYEFHTETLLQIKVKHTYDDNMYVTSGTYTKQ